MITIDVLSSIEGRKLLKEIFYSLKYKKQNHSLYVLFSLFRICTYDRDIHKYVNIDVKVEHSLGLFRGTGLWMEEVVNQYYFSTVNSFVYFGAAILLVLIGMRRFSDILTDEIVIAGVIFEACMLLMMFVLMLFTPEDDLIDENESDNSLQLIDEVGEIARDFAATSVRLEELNNKYNEMLLYQKEIINKQDKLIDNISMTVSPNNAMLHSMNETNIQINQLKSNFEQLNIQLEQLRKEEIERTVRKEIENIISNRMINDKK